jgi:Holliday junction resolvase
MPKSSYSDKRDQNEPEIVKEFERLGFYVIRMARTAGFDLLVIGQGMTLIVEVKNPDGGTYTIKEIELRGICAIKNVNYYVIVSVSEVEDLLRNAKRTV